LVSHHMRSRRVSVAGAPPPSFEERAQRARAQRE
jgi:hypothetical protein